MKRIFMCMLIALTGFLALHAEEGDVESRISELERRLADISEDLDEIQRQFIVADPTGLTKGQGWGQSWGMELFTDFPYFADGFGAGIGFTTPRLGDFFSISAKAATHVATAVSWLDGDYTDWESLAWNATLRFTFSTPLIFSNYRVYCGPEVTAAWMQGLWKAVNLDPSLSTTETVMVDVFSPMLTLFGGLEYYLNGHFALFAETQFFMPWEVVYQDGACREPEALALTKSHLNLTLAAGIRFYLAE